jgi:acyl carrier protein
MMHQDPLFDRVSTMLVAVTAIPAEQIRPESTLRVDLAMDSVSSLEMLGMLSEEFGVEVELEETEGLETVAQVVALIRDRTVAHA